MSVLRPAPLQERAALMDAPAASWKADSCGNSSHQPSLCRFWARLDHSTPQQHAGNTHSCVDQGLVRGPSPRRPQHS